MTTSRAAENVVRLDLSPVEAVALGVALEKRERQRAKKRMVDAHASPGKFPEQTKGQTRDKVGKVADKGEVRVRPPEELSSFVRVSGPASRVM